MEQLRCRTCFEITDVKKCIEISQICYFEKTIKDVIIMLVPDMVSTLSDDENICRNCFKTLRTSMRFIERCLEVELMHAEEEKQFETYEEIDESANVEEGQLDEDGEIIIIDNLNSIDLEHDYYVKQEPEDYETFNSENENSFMPDEEYLPQSPENYETLNNDTEEISSIPDEELLPDEEHLKDDEEQLPDEENIPESLPNDEVSDQPADQRSNSPAEYVFYDLLTLYKDICDDKVEIENCDEPENSNACTIEELQMTLDDSEVKEEVSDVKVEGEALSCQSCSEKFTSEDEYNAHLDIHPPFICQHCGKGFKVKKSFKYHERIHKTQLATLCEICGKTFKGSGALNLHVSSVHSTQFLYMCDRCPKTYKNKFKLGVHVRMVHERVQQQQCQECDKVFQSKESCVNHYRLVHLKLKPFVCDICGKGFGRNDYLRKHRSFHTGEPWNETPVKRSPRMPKYGIRLRDPGVPVSCKVCGKMIRSVHLLKVHLETHVRMKRQKCKYCPLTFKMTNNRDRHQRLHEVDPVNRFRCNICWKRMKTEEELTVHTIGHSNRPPQHSCDICGEKFHRKYLLDNHNLDQHTGPGDIERAENEIVVQNLLEFADPFYLTSA